MWENQLGYLEYNVEGNSSENRGYTGGIVGFASRTHDMLSLVQQFAKVRPEAELARFIPALEKVDGTSSREGLGEPFEKAWKAAATDAEFRRLQLQIADDLYLRPAIAQAAQDRVGRLGQFMYYDALVVHGPGKSVDEFSGIRENALKLAPPPSDGGQEENWLNAFATARRAAMKREEGHSDTSRIDNAQVRWLKAGNVSLTLPLDFEIYGDRYHLEVCPK